MGDGGGGGGDGGDGGDGRISPEHPSPILHAPRDIISRKGKSLTPISCFIESIVTPSYHACVAKVFWPVGSITFRAFLYSPKAISRSEGFTLTGYDIPGCVEDGAWMLWENSSVAAVAAVAAAAAVAHPDLE